MSAAYKEMAIQALERMRGDDLYRARAAFSRKSPAEMNREYGMSGQTCAQILAGYEKRDAEVTAAIKWIEGVGDMSATTTTTGAEHE
jgi:hypothetical protein